MSDVSNIRLTETVKKGGCAAKLPAGQLREILGALDLTKPKELIVGTDTMDDAALWDLGDGRLLIQTLDFFTPIVDDPFEFGAIAASNALSDVYAMGGKPATAMTILAFPCSSLPMELLNPLMRGAIDKIQEAGACLVGGHSIDDETLKLGFSVSGFVARDRAWTNSGAKPGDKLILTKGLGTGTITSALKTQKAPESAIKAAIASMKLLNRVGELVGGYKIHAATDVTGFGFAGHLLQMMRASQTSAQVVATQLPAIAGALDLLQQEVLNRAHHTNLKYVESEVDFGQVAPELRWLSVDPQTSGGILLAAPSDQADAIVESLRSQFPLTAIVGGVREMGSKFIEFV